MKVFIVVVLLVVAVVYVGGQVSDMYKTKTDLNKCVERRLDQVDESSIPAVKQELIKEALKLGVQLSTGDILITCEDTDVQSMAQRLVGGKTGAQFRNKRVGIRVQYQVRVVGLPVAQEVAQAGIRQVAATPPAPQRAAKEVLDTP